MLIVMEEGEDGDHGDDKSNGDNVDSGYIHIYPYPYISIYDVVGGDAFNDEDVSDAGNKVGSPTQPSTNDDDCKQSLLRFHHSCPVLYCRRQHCLNHDPP